MKYYPVKEGNKNLYCFGLELNGVANQPTYDKMINNVENWLIEQNTWRQRLASILISPPDHKKVELKFIKDDSKSRGKLKVCLLVFLDPEKGELDTDLQEAWQDLQAMINLNRSNYLFSPITSKKDLQRLIKPFKSKCQVELVRTGVSFYPASGVGFSKGSFPENDLSTLPFPIKSEVSNLRLFCRFLAEYPAPIEVSIQARPYNGTINDCRFGKAVSNPNQVELEQVEAVRDRASELGRREKKLCYMNIFISAEKTLTEPVINALGADLLTEDTDCWQALHIPANNDHSLQIEDKSTGPDFKRLYCVEEAARVFRFPLAGNDGVPGLESVYPYIPQNLSSSGAVLGFKEADSGQQTVRINESDRDKHVYILGQTGTGKTTLLYSMAMSDIREGRGICVIDPHDDLHERLLARIPDYRKDDVILIDPNDYDYPVGINLLEAGTEKEKNYVANELIQIIRKVYDPGSQGLTGPVFEQAVRNAALTAMSFPRGGTVVDLTELLTDKSYLEKALEYISDERVRRYWENIWLKYNRDFSELLAYITSKFDNINSDPFMRRVLGQAKSTINFRQIMDEGKIVLVNLSKGNLGELNSYLLGSILTFKIFSSALGRYDQPPEKRKPFCLYIDEFQNFTTDTIHSMLSEARKYQLSLVLAHQNLKQLSDTTRQIVLGNVGSLIFFRPGTDDADFVQEYLRPYFYFRNLLELPNWTAIGRVMIEAAPSRPFTFQVDKDRTAENLIVADYVRQRMRKEYASYYKDVEAEINIRIKSIKIL